MSRASLKRSEKASYNKISEKARFFSFPFRFSRGRNWMNSLVVAIAHLGSFVWNGIKTIVDVAYYK